MKLDEQQKIQLAAIFTGKQLDRVITAIQKQRGPQTYFKNGNLVMTKDEIIARLKRTEKRNIWMAKKERKEKVGRAIASLEINDLKVLKKKIDCLIQKKNKSTINKLKNKVSLLNRTINTLERPL